MKLNPVERLVVNNPVRAWLQNQFEARRFLRLGGDCAGARALEIGGGQGEGARVIRRFFGASQVLSLDLDELMVRRSQKRTLDDPAIHCLQADCTALPLEDGAVDALFDFGVIHHVPQWRDAVAELTRVARPGAKLYAMEVYRSLICHPVWKRVLTHPQHDRFSHQELQRQFLDHGWRLLGDRTLTGGLGWMVLEKNP